MNNRKLILSSTSRPRKALLERLLLPFETLSPNLDETPQASETPQELVLRLAKGKAQIAAKKYSDALIIGADQVGVLENQIQGKPLTHENAVQQLQAASGKRMEFYIGLCLFDSRDQSFQLALEEFDVVYRNLSPAMIENYLRREQPFECAGSCQAEGLGIALIEEFQGKDFTALIGLPLIRLIKMLEKAGLDPLSYPY